MANLTITMDDEALKRARIRALTQGTSVNAVLREFLESYAGLRPEQEGAMRDLFSISERSEARRGSRRWSRDELHER
ncbi:MAG: hypothetical protein ACRELU_05455 [Gemmatimonadota bacterium]